MIIWDWPVLLQGLIHSIYLVILQGLDTVIYDSPCHTSRFEYTWHFLSYFKVLIRSPRNARFGHVHLGFILSSTFGYDHLGLPCNNSRFGYSYLVACVLLFFWVSQISYFSQKYKVKFCFIYCRKDIWKNTPVTSHGYWWLTSRKWIVANLTDFS